MSLLLYSVRLLQPHRQSFGGCLFHTCRKLDGFQKIPLKQKIVPLNQQSVLLPGVERIRASKLADDPHELVRLIPYAQEIKTVYDVLAHGLKISGDGDCVGAKDTSASEYKWISYSTFISKADCVGSGLVHLGLKPSNESLVGIFAANRPEFSITLYGCAAYSMVLIPLYLSQGLESILFIINQANLEVLIVNNDQNARMLLQNLQKVPSLRTLVMMDRITEQLSEVGKTTNVQLLSFDDLEELGRKNKSDLVLPNPGDLFCIPYTSGTTGTPKGVMLTHESMISYMAGNLMSSGDAGFYGGTVISYLPTAHIFEILNQVGCMFMGRRMVFFADDIKLLMPLVKKVKPSGLSLVPRLVQVLYDNAMKDIRKSFFKLLLLKRALKGKENLLLRGKITRDSIWDKLVFKDFQESLGGEMDVIGISSAPVPAEVMAFFRRASGAHVFEAYGQTEVLAATKTLPLEIDGGTVGPPLPNNHIKLVDVPEMGCYAKDDIGEVCVKGPTVFKGYFKNEEATRESLIDGWQHTGDIGTWLPNGALKIVDRKKHLFKLSQGEYIAPEKIQNIYNKSELVLQSFVDGFSDKNYAIVLVFPELSNLKQWLKKKGYTEIKDMSSIESNKDLRKEFLMELRQIGYDEGLNSLEQARNLAFLSEPFTLQNDFLTPTLKLKRNYIRKSFHDRFQQLYDEGPLV